MTFSELRREYESETIGALIFGRIRDVVRRVAPRYPPAVYSEVGTPEGDWTEEALDALVQAFTTDSLLGDGQLDYTMSQAVSLTDFDRLTAFQLRRHLRRFRRQSIIDNLIGRVRRLLQEPPYTPFAAGDERWALAGRELEDRQPRVEELAEAVRRASLVPREVANALERAPRVYAPEDLAALLEAIMESLECPLSLDHVRWVFKQLLTEMVASDLLPLHGDMPEDEDSVEYSAWAEASLRVESGRGGDLMARPEPSPEEAVLVTETVRSLLAALDAEQAQILRMKLARASDGDIAIAVSRSRQTIVKRNKEIAAKIAEHFGDLDERWHSRALDELVRRLAEGWT